MKWKFSENTKFVSVVNDCDEEVYLQEKIIPNAREEALLIAAAPEMLALLKTSRRNLSSIIAACNCNTYDPWLGEMDRVIALAEGGEK